MNALSKIGDLSKQLNISTRTLRYYEEIGLIQSTKKGDSKYRHYDSHAISRINQILLLRRLSFSIKEIQEFYSLKDSKDILPILSNKLTSLKSELKEQRDLTHVIEKLIKVLELSVGKNESSLITLENMCACEREVLDNETEQLVNVEGIENKKILGDIRIIKLRRMRVAYYCAVSDQPENDAWDVMIKWVKAKKLENLFTTRYLGFNNPDPIHSSNVYGYEVWTTVTEDVKGNDLIGIKMFEGGLYAVANTNMYDIVQSWQQLYNQIKNSDEYEMSNHRWLEENIILTESSWGSNMQVDLYCPIKLL